MLSLSHVLVATDLSPASRSSLALARRVADAFGARLTLAHIVSWPDAGAFEVPGDAPTAAQENAEERDLARQALAAFADGAADDLAVRHSRVPALALADLARETRADLMVLGMCGERPRRATLGATAAELVQTAPCDVLLVPGRAPTDADPAATAPPGLRRVLVGVDFSRRSRALAGVGVAVARALGADADLVHVLEPLPHPLRWIDQTVLDLTPQIHDRAVEALRELAGDLDQDLGPGPAPGLYVERGPAARTLPRVAEALGADLVVVGPHGDRPLFDRLLGNVAEGMARRAPCPVWIARRSAEPVPDDQAADPFSYELEPPTGPPPIQPSPTAA